MGKEIFMLDIEEFPAHIFKGNFTGFSKSYISMAGGHLIIGNSLKTVKNLLEDHYNDNTWGKSLSYKDILKDITTDNFHFTSIKILDHYILILKYVSPKSFLQYHILQLSYGS